jgi:Icc-related predicted phosphoesterase
MRILAVSDVESNLVYSPQIGKRFRDIDLAIGCGDLPYYYLEFIISSLDIPLYFVRGNHASHLESGENGDRTAPWGAIDLHQRVLRDHSGLLMAGIEGSIRYNNGFHQYTQSEMWSMVMGLVPGLYLNRLRYGRYLDVFVTHSPPWKIHDMEDRPHRGIKAFNWLVKVFQPTFHLHGHVHVYRSDTITETQIGQTRVINTFGYRELTLDLERLERRARRAPQPSGKENKA